MSRTDKDRPYWVRCNDATEGRHVVHHHEWAGRPIFASRLKRDENGKVVTEKRSVWIAGHKIYHYADGHVQTVPQNWYGRKQYAFYDKAELLHIIIEPSHYENREFPTYELVEVGRYPDECTIDRPREAWSRELHKLNDATCWVELETYVVKPWRHRPAKKDKHIYHSGARASELANNRNVAKTYNAGGDVEEFDWEDYIPRQQRHIGWWD